MLSLPDEFFCVHVTLCPIAPNPSNYSINVGLTCLMQAYIIFLITYVYLYLCVRPNINLCIHLYDACDHVYAFWLRVCQSDSVMGESSEFISVFVIL